MTQAPSSEESPCRDQVSFRHGQTFHVHKCFEWSNDKFWQIWFVQYGGNELGLVNRFEGSSRNRKWQPCPLPSNWYQHLPPSCTTRKQNCCYSGRSNDQWQLLDARLPLQHHQSALPGSPSNAKKSVKMSKQRVICENINTLWPPSRSFFNNLSTRTSFPDDWSCNSFELHGQSTRHFHQEYVSRLSDFKEMEKRI